jgi:hypothetical protein
MKTLAIIADLINGAWGLIFKLALVVIAIALAVSFFNSCAGGGLTEHSSCQDYQKADTDAQNKVIEDMIAAHGGNKNSFATTRASVELYCNFHSPDSPIDGIYSSGKVSQPIVQALHIEESNRLARNTLDFLAFAWYS